MNHKKYRFLAVLIVLVLSAWIVWLGSQTVAGPLLFLAGALITLAIIEIAKFHRH